MDDYNVLSPDAKVWIYQAERNLEEAEIEIIDEALAGFVKDWAAHGQNLKAYGRIYHERFVVLVVDETQAGASGCSIDSSVHFVQDLGKVLAIDFFKRTQIVYVGEEGQMHDFELAKLNELWQAGTLDDNTKVFNNLVKTKAALETEWLVPIKETWMKNKIKVVS